MSRLDVLRQALTELFASVGPVSFREQEFVGIPRLTVERVVDGETRYLRFTPLPEGSVWEFELLMGISGSKDASRNLDGRNGGDMRHAVRIAELWLVRLREWEDLPRPPGY
ncbi:hypothetical protein HPC49_13625 [Pyxidicoccus fallax]|uniref:Uncharacterized protein n=1 Tax=Pyxidicoccus fallax TaxID=394095 RepID=A0A848LCM3_9BACT|nr:hypothetical protein [Pyxidicoccus fallax]NMO14565.1 hypothetical protein [Pyxidicoccus fallax]NPC79274.1 hypothetical protein [Pyxidicoccus fallax]